MGPKVRLQWLSWDRCLACFVAFFVFRWACCCNPPPYGNACRFLVRLPLGALLYFGSLHPNDNAHRFILPVSLRVPQNFWQPFLMIRLTAVSCVFLFASYFFFFSACMLARVAAPCVPLLLCAFCCMYDIYLYTSKYLY